MRASAVAVFSSYLFLYLFFYIHLSSFIIINIITIIIVCRGCPTWLTRAKKKIPEMKWEKHSELLQRL